MAFASHSVTPPRNGACRLPSRGLHDARFLQALNDGVQSAAREQDVGGEELDLGTLEAFGPTDWRALLRRGLRSSPAERAFGAWTP